MTPANWPIPLVPVTLRGRFVQLEPLAADHESELSNICEDEEIWRYLTSYGGTAHAMHCYIEACLRDYLSGSAYPFVIRIGS